MIAGAESTMAGAELSIGGGGGEGHPKGIQIDTNDHRYKKTIRKVLHECRFHAKHGSRHKKSLYRVSRN